MKLETEVAKLSEYMDAKELTELLSTPLEFFPEDVSAMIPSLAMGEDGPSLTSIFLFSENYICEAQISGNNEKLFDFTDKRNVINIRVNLGKHDIVVDEQIVASYDTAHVNVMHRPEMHSVLSYFGSRRSDWVARVLKEIPIGYVLRT
ncbi:hypothetical protein F4X86_03965 [Candidatus Saccharibacteria bacterium]|nr:hypothetical protein [Candidatus Saccharibacteria bacterium]